MSKFYAQIDKGFLVGVSQLSGKVENENLIPISNEDYTALMTRFYKAKYSNGQWIEGATPEEIEAILNPPQPVDPVEELKEENALLAFELITTQLDLAQTKQEHADLILYLVETGVI